MVVPYAVGRIWHTQLLHRREVDHVVACLPGHCQAWLPLIEWPKQLGDDCLDA